MYNVQALAFIKVFLGLIWLHHNDRIVEDKATAFDYFFLSSYILAYIALSWCKLQFRSQPCFPIIYVLHQKTYSLFLVTLFIKHVETLAKISMSATAKGLSEIFDVGIFTSHLHHTSIQFIFIIIKHGPVVNATSSMRFLLLHCLL